MNERICLFFIVSLNGRPDASLRQTLFVDGRYVFVFALNWQQDPKEMEIRKQRTHFLFV